MRYSHIAVLITALFLCLISCGETHDRKQNSWPEEDSASPIEQKEIKSSIQIDSTSSPLKTTQEKKIKKKKKKASDTLRPKVATL